MTRTQIFNCEDIKHIHMSFTSFHFLNQIECVPSYSNQIIIHLIGVNNLKCNLNCKYCANQILKIDLENSQNEKNSCLRIAFPNKIFESIYIEVLNTYICFEYGMAKNIVLKTITGNINASFLANIDTRLNLETLTGDMYLAFHSVKYIFGNFNELGQKLSGNYKSYSEGVNINVQIKTTSGHVNIS